MLRNPLCECETDFRFPLEKYNHGKKYMEPPFRAEMVLNLTRTVATQAVRGFTHQTWVSGRLNKKNDYLLKILKFPAGPPRTRIPFAEKCAHGILISAGVLAGCYQ